MMTTPMDTVSTVRELVKTYFEDHIVDERDDAIARIGQAEDTATFTVRQVAADTTGADRRAAQDARDEAVAGAERVGSAESVTAAVAAVAGDREAAQQAATESATSASASAESARQAAETASAGIPDGGVDRIKLAPEVIDELNSKADRQATEQALAQKLDAAGVQDAIAGKTDIGHKHLMEDIDDLPEVSDAPEPGTLVARDQYGNLLLPNMDGSSDIAIGSRSVQNLVGLVANQLIGQVETRTTPDTVSSMITAAVDALVGGAPEALDTLYEIAAELENQDEAVAALITQIAGKAKLGHRHDVTEIDGAASVGYVDDVQGIADNVADALGRLPDETIQPMIEAHGPRITFAAAGSAPDVAPAGQLILEYED